jgi:hypothetical protein
MLQIATESLFLMLKQRIFNYTASIFAIDAIALLALTGLVGPLPTIVRHSQASTMYPYDYSDLACLIWRSLRGMVVP